MIEGPASFGQVTSFEPARLRRTVRRSCPTDADLEAFCRDYFPEVHRRITSAGTVGGALDRTARENLLIEMTETRRAELALALHEFARERGIAVVSDVYLDAAGHIQDELLLRVRAACLIRERHREKLTLQVHSEPGAPLRILEVAYSNRRFSVRYGLGATDQIVDQATLDNFFAELTTRFLGSSAAAPAQLVYAGPAPSAATLAAAEQRLIELVSLDDYEALLSLGPAVQRQTARLGQDLRYPPSLYVQQRMQLCRDASFRFNESTDHGLDEVTSWLRSPHSRFVLLLGDFGAGKTFMLYELMRRLGQAGGPLMPLLCELRQIEKAQDLSMLLVQHMRQAGIEPIDPEALLHMLELGRVVLCFDGFDELALRTSFDRAAEHLETLLQAVRGQAKVVVTSRTQHFVNDQQIKTMLGQKLDRVPCYVGRLLPFERPQILQFLRNRLGDEERAQQRYRLLDEIKDLLGLSHNPRMLGFIAQIEESKLIEAQRQQGTISAAGLYQILVDDWLDFEIRRRSERVADRSLSKQQLLEAATRLALRLWQKTERTAGLAEIEAASRGALEDIEVAVHQVGSASLLVRDAEGRFSFLHQSVLEWLVARAAAAEVQAGGRGDVLGSGDMSELMAEFFIGILNRNAATAWAGQALKATDSDAATAFRKDNALLVFRRMRQPRQMPSERLKLMGQNLRGQDLSGQNLRWVDLSRADLRGALLIGTRLPDSDLQHANLGGADLRRADLRRADLRHADLRRANLIGADLRGAKLEGANFDAAKLIGLRMDDGAASIALSLAGPPISALRPQTVPRLGLAPSAYAGQCLAWSPDGSLLALGMDSGAIALLDNPLPLGAVLRTLHTSNGEAHAVAFSPDGKLLAGAYQDGTVRLWAVDSGEPQRSFSGHERAVFGVAFSADGQLLASASQDKTVRIWRVADGAEQAVLTGHEGAVFSVAFSPKAELLASGSGDRTVRLWRVDQLEDPVVLQGPKQSVWSVSFSADGRYIAAGCWDRSVHRWAVDGDKSPQVLGEYPASVYSVAWSPVGNRLVAGLADGEVRLISTDKEEPNPTIKERSTHTPVGHRGAVLAVTWSPDGAYVASASFDRTVRIFREERGALHPHVTLSGSTMPVSEIAFSPDGKMLFCAARDQVRAWDLPTGVLHELSPRVRGPVYSIAVSPDGQCRAAGVAARAIRLSRAGSEDDVVLEGHTGHVNSLAFSPDNRRLASASSDRTLRLWSISDGQLLQTLTGFNHEFNRVRWSPDGKLMVAVSRDHRFRLFRENPSGQFEESESEQRGSFSSVNFSPDGSLIVTGSEVRTVRLWRVADGTLLHEMTGHSGAVRDVAFSPNGKIVASVSRDQTVCLWSVASGRKLAVLRDCHDAVSCVAFHPDGKILASASLDGTVRLWSVEERRCLAVLLASDRGWVSFLPDGRYKPGGEPSSVFWHVLGRSRLEVGELDEFMPGLRLPDSASLLDPPPWIPTILLPAPAPSVQNVPAPPSSTELPLAALPPQSTAPASVRDAAIAAPQPSARRMPRWLPRAIIAVLIVAGGLAMRFVLRGAPSSREDANAAPPAHTHSLLPPPPPTEKKESGSSRGFKLADAEEAAAVPLVQTRGRAVLFATTQYDDKRWPQLKTPQSDAQEIADDLRNLYGFAVERVENPNVEDIRQKIRSLAEQRYADDEQLFIMFSGHGDKDETLRKGWIIARDTRTDERRSAYPYSELREDIDNIPCKHILLVLDVCFGGSFDPSIKDAQSRTRQYEEASTAAFIARKLRYRSRLYVSSVDQKTQAPEGRGHSPFAWKLLEALRSGGGRDGVLTWNELLGFLEKLNPEPRGGVFPGSNNNDPGGDFLFVVKGQTAQPQPP